MGPTLTIGGMQFQTLAAQPEAKRHLIPAIHYSIRNFRTRIQRVHQEAAWLVAPTNGEFVSQFLLLRTDAVTHMHSFMVRIVSYAEMADGLGLSPDFALRFGSR